MSFRKMLVVLVNHEPFDEILLIDSSNNVSFHVHLSCFPSICLAKPFLKIFSLYLAFFITQVTLTFFVLENFEKNVF